VSQSFFVICILNVLLSNVFLQFLYVFFTIVTYVTQNNAFCGELLQLCFLVWNDAEKCGVRDWQR